MMTVRTAILATTLLVATAVPALAALPPYYQRVREIEAILNSDEVRQKLDQAPIDAITYIDGDVYDVLGGACELQVMIVDVPPEPGKELMVGPRQFTLEIGAPDCGPGDEDAD